MTMTELGNATLNSVRTHFAPLFDHYGFRLVTQHDDLNFASLTAQNNDLYLRVRSDFRDRTVTAFVGRLSEGLVPPIPIAPSSSADGVREIPHPILVWLATGDKGDALATGIYDEEDPAEIDRAVKRTAEVLTRYGVGLLAGDEQEWKRAVELTVSRRWSASP